MILGLTGFSGSGKSTVASLLKEHGFHHIDCDRLVHEEVYRSKAVLDALVAAFGQAVINNGSLDRQALRERTFGNPAAVSRLNQTVMPYILSAIEQQLAEHAEKNIILDAPLLFEYRLEEKCDCTLSVLANEEIAVNRIIQRDQISEEAAKKRLSNQHPAAFYIDKSDFVIMNNGNLKALEQQVAQFIKELYE